MRIALNLLVAVGSMDIFVLILPICKHGRSIFLYLQFIFSSVFMFYYTSISFGYIYSKISHLPLFEVFVSEIVSLISFPLCLQFVLVKAPDFSMFVRVFYDSHRKGTKTAGYCMQFLNGTFKLVMVPNVIFSA